MYPVFHFSQPYPILTTPWQYDGNLTTSSAIESTDTQHEANGNHSNLTQPSLNDSPNFTPQLHSTPTQGTVILPLLDSLEPSSPSLSLQSWSDLDNFLPFAIPADQIPGVTHPSLDHDPAHSDLSDLTVSPHAIPVMVGINPDPDLQLDILPRPPCRKTIRRDKHVGTALSLPNVMVTNHRSIFPKFNNLVDEILENQMHLGLHSEIWEDKEKPAHANAIEEALEIHGIQYISTPRPNRRGGGAAITLISDSPFVLTKLDIPIMAGQQELEICWGLLRPRTPTGHIKCIIVCAFYLPPNSRKKSALVEHISLNYFSLKAQYQDSAFLLGGDKNDLNIQLLLDIDPSFRQIVSGPTYKQAVLDVLVTDIGQYYMVPIIRPPVQPDNPATASPSDHRIAFAKAKTSSSEPVKREVMTQVVRPLSADALSSFASWVQHESWEYVYDGADPSDMVNRFNNLVALNLDLHCPSKTIKTTNLDGKLSSAAVKQASRRKNREYHKHGNSAKYKILKKEVKAKLKEASTNFLENQTKLVASKNTSWLKHVKRLTARPGDQSSSTFTLPQHVEDGLTALESSNQICEFFSSISQEYTPLNIESLPAHVQAKLAHDPCSHPHLADHVVYEGLKRGKKTCSVPGDLPVKILNEFLPELTAPVAAIYREAIATHTWPDPFKKEYHLPINKVPIPQTEDDLRNLGLTPFFSKRLEWFLIQWIWPYISPHIDLDQLGGLPGCSVNHYLVQMMDFIHKNLDNGTKKPTAVLAGLVDFSKAFNRIDHNVIVTILSDLNIPTCALRLVMSYLSNRKMCVRYNGAVSGEQDIPGGGPQGGLLTVLLFDLQVNLAGAPCPLLPLLSPGVEGPDPGPLQEGPLPLCHQADKTLKKKYVDDLTLLEAVSLPGTLVPTPPIIGPANIHEIPQLSLPPDRSVLQHQLADLAEFTDKNKMKINHKKTKILPFNCSKKFDFLPQLHFPLHEPLEVIYETRLLGVTISSNLSWSAHVNDITKRATKKLWVLIRFKSLGGTTDQLLTVYRTRVRSTLEFAAPVFHSGLTKDQGRQIEMVQKKAMAIILGSEYTSYEFALTKVNLERLDSRRSTLSLNFAQKCAKSHQHKSMFPSNPNFRPNMRNPKPYREYLCNTSRYYMSSIPFLARLLNKNTKT